MHNTLLSSADAEANADTIVGQVMTALEQSVRGQGV
jgi:hypothetical protein